jgi:PAS domain S-box-containing protein
MQDIHKRRLTAMIMNHVTAAILIIDDEETLRFSFSKFLEEEGCDVVTAPGILRALEILGSAPVDVVFCDIVLPEGSGVDVLRRVRDMGLLCPVVMITGEPTIETASDAVRLGAFDYLSKPVRRDTLIRVCGQALRHKRLLEENRRFERERERYRRDLDLLFRSVSEGIAIVDSAMNVLRINESFADILETKPDAVLGKPFAAIMNATMTGCYRMLLQVMETKREVRDFRTAWKRSDGAPQAAVINILPLFEQSRDFAGAALFLRDITCQADLESRLAERFGFCRLTGRSKKMQDLYLLLEALAETDTTVLLTGESGTGKELVAEALHYAGPRAQRPLVKVNCSALSENLLESELFGHVKGAFTGADRDRIGRFQMAQGGTIMLDEIGDIAPRLQIKLLRVLQEKEFERVGDAVPIKADVRIIAATNSDLAGKMSRGEFRNDLYYRLKVVEIDLPPLRERLEDLPLLADEFRRSYNEIFKKTISGLSGDVLDALLRYSWPGNIRELKHVIEHAFVLCHDDVISIEHLPPCLRQPLLQQENIQDTLKKAGGNKSCAARLLGVSRQTVYRKMKKRPDKQNLPA